MVNNCGILVLAAGKSQRMGTPKQLLRYQGKTLLQHAVEAALATAMQPVLLVLGARVELMKEELAGIKGVEFLENKEWEEGMASSIRAGLQAIVKSHPATDGVIVMVCDQPFINPELLRELLETQHQSWKPVVASGYKGTGGVPVLFHKSYFGRLMELKGDTGARKIIKEHAEEVELVPFPQGEKDIDTIADYSGLKQNFGDD